MQKSMAALFLIGNLMIGAACAEDRILADDLAGHWKLAGDCRDHSGNGNHGINHGVDLATGGFNGVDSYIEVPHKPGLALGTSDFTLCTWAFTDDEVDDVVGDVFEMYDPARRRGVTLAVATSSGGYQGQGTDRHVQFGIDNGRLSAWQDCGRPSEFSNYVSNSLVVFQNDLYAATTDAQDEAHKRHVYRYAGGKEWIDCGQVGNHRSTGVGPLLVHQGQLYAVTWTYDWTRVRKGDYEPGRLYRYRGGKDWEDCGQPSENRTLNCIASYRGNLYIGGGPDQLGVFVSDGNGQWRQSKLFPTEGLYRCFPHTMCRFNGKLYTAYPAVYAFDGGQWAFAGIPADTVEGLQTHSMTIYQGRLCAGTWPEATVWQFAGGEKWENIGRVGEDGTEVNSLVVYNGKLYGGSLPRSEVCRYDGQPIWTSLERFYDPENWQPGLPNKANRQEVNEWSRITSMTVHKGRLFASTGSCTSSIVDAPCDVRGKVFSIEAGKCASYGGDLGPGWKHIAAVRRSGKLTLYIDGAVVAESTEFDPAEYDLTNTGPAAIGRGQLAPFCGKLRDVRLYKRALPDAEIAKLVSAGHDN